MLTATATNGMEGTQERKSAAPEMQEGSPMGSLIPCSRTRYAQEEGKETAGPPGPWEEEGVTPAFIHMFCGDVGKTPHQGEV